MEGKALRLLLSFALVTSSICAFAQQSSLSEIDQLRAQLEKQQQRIEALESALAGQQKTLVKLGLVDSKPESSAAVEHPATYRETPTYEVESQNNAAPSQEQQPLSPKAQQVEDQLQRGPEIADVTPTTPALNLGPAKIRIDMQLSRIFTGRPTKGEMSRPISRTCLSTIRSPAIPVNSGFRRKIADWPSGPMQT